MLRSTSSGMGDMLGDMQKTMMQQMQQGMQQGFQLMQLQAGPTPPHQQQQAWQQHLMGKQQLQAGWAAQQQQAQPPQHGLPAYTSLHEGRFENSGTILPSGKYAPPAGSTWTASGALICNTCNLARGAHLVSLPYQSSQPGPSSQPMLPNYMTL